MNTNNLSTNEQNVIMEEATKADFYQRLKKIFNNTELNKVLKSVGLKNHKMKKFSYLENSSEDERYSLELVTQLEDSQSQCHDIVVDFQFGSQFINVTYDVGCEYDKKIIIYENDFNKKFSYDPPGAWDVIDDLVNINNKCGVKTYLVEAKGLLQYMLQGEKKRISYHLVKGPCGNDINLPELVLHNGELPRQLPTKRQVQVSEFWLGYYFPNWGMGRSFDDHNVIEEWTPGYSLAHDLSTKAYWNDDGFFIDLVGEPDSERIKWIWANRQSVFSEAYSDCPVVLKSENNKPCAISVKISDVIMEELIKMKPEDKWYYGEMVYGQEHKFWEVAQKAIENYNDAKKPAEIAIGS
jgi:hypothetical protein